MYHYKIFPYHKILTANPSMKNYKLPENLPKSATQRINEIAAVAHHLPEAVIIHSIADWTVVWMSDRGLKLLGATLEEITALTAEGYHKRYFNIEDSKDLVPKLAGLLEENNDETMVTFFQQVRFSENGNWTWHMSSVKIFARDDAGNPILSITIAIPIDAMHHMSAKASRLLEENNFLRSNFKSFSLLSRREKEILRLMALSKTSGEIAGELFISSLTADTHKRNIRNKLKVSSPFELAKYARAFDLI